MTGYKSKRAAAQDKLDSMEREALKLALEALRMADELCRGHGVDFKEYGLEFDRDIQVKYKDAITAIKEALAQPAQEPPPWWPAVENILTEYGLQAIDFVADFNAALAGREWNFCERCGKRTADLTVIHTCTPPLQEKNA